MSTIVAFTAEHVCALTRLSKRQLSYWVATDFFCPTAVTTGGRRFAHIYTFRDVVGLRTIALLRNEHKVSLQELRRVGAWLHQHYDDPWASLRLGLAGKHVVFFDPVTGVPTVANDGRQTVIKVALTAIADDMSEAAEALRQRDRKEIGKLTRNRYVVHNAWVLAGTRVPSAAVWRFHEAGYGIKDIIGEYPSLTARDVKVALDFEASRRKAA